MRPHLAGSATRGNKGGRQTRGCTQALVSDYYMDGALFFLVFGQLLHSIERQQPLLTARYCSASSGKRASACASARLAPSIAHSRRNSRWLRRRLLLLLPLVDGKCSHWLCSSALAPAPAPNPS